LCGVLNDPRKPSSELLNSCHGSMTRQGS
jgi:hypothetical protein